MNHLFDQSMTLERELQDSINKLMIFKEKYTKNENKIKKVEQKLIDMNRELSKIKRLYLDSSDKQTLTDNQNKILRKEINDLKNELKTKNILISSLETKKRQIIEPTKETDKCSKQRFSSIANTKCKKIKAESSKIQASSNIKQDTIQILNEPKARIDKTIALQSLVLSKSKELAEKEIIIEEYEKQLIEMNQKINKINKYEKLKLIAIKPKKQSINQCLPPLIPLIKQQ